MPGFGDKVLRLIAGSGRSGTTWLLDALAEANGIRPVFEPLHTDASAVGQRFGYAYLTRATECTELKGVFSAAADGTSGTIWTDYRIRPHRLHLKRKHLRSLTELKALVHLWRKLLRRYVVYQKRKSKASTIVKCIRANLMLDWIHATFDARIVFLMRHPGATVESRLRFAEHWDPFPLLAQYRNDTALVSGPLSLQAAWLDHKFTRAEALTVLWCIENLVPAAQAAANRYLVVFYEELLEQPDAQWSRIVERLDLDHIPPSALLALPSQQAAVRLNQGSASGGDYVKSYGRWRARMKADDLAQVDSVLRAFGIDFYSIADIRPNVDAFTQRFLREPALSR